MKTNLLSYFAGLLLFMSMSCKKESNTISISIDTSDSRLDFAFAQIAGALESQGDQLELVTTDQAKITLSLDTSLQTLNSEGFVLAKEGDNLQIKANEAAGLMYGGLELAEQIKLYGISDIQEMEISPYMEMRGPKFNIPLDVRTPSYSDASDAGQNNISAMWDMTFWEEYLDQLAMHRYNYVSLWSLHPFPSLVKVPGYEEIALDDVKKSIGQWNENYDLNATEMDAPEILAETETLLELNIDEKIAFWRQVMAYGKKRNIDFHIITWNIFDYGTEGKYGITDEIDNEITKDYFRKSVKELFVTYPDLAGIGLTTGENMKGTTAAEREDWAYETYALGLMDAAAEMPNRQFTFIHRQHQTGAKEIAEKFKSVIETENIEFLYCFKYAKAHVYSATKQPYHEDAHFVEDIGNMKTIWGLRNDDTYYFRWGAPGFVREFIDNIPHDVAKGIYFGSDQWIWGRDFLSKNPLSKGQLEIEKHWYQWLLWGRLSFDPELPDERITDILQHRFPEIKGSELFAAWQESSMIYPVTTGFHWGRLDFQWYIEGCKSRPRQALNETGFHDVNRFISLGTHPKSGYQSIPEFVKMTLDRGSTDLMSPLKVSKELHRLSDSALERIAKFPPTENLELQQTIQDIKTVSHLGKYYAHKIAGATHLEMFRKGLDSKHQQNAINELQEALSEWQIYTELAMQQNHNPLWTNRVGNVDWTKFTQYASDDIQIAQNSISEKVSND